MDLLQVDLGLFVDGHQKEIVLLVLEEQVLGMPAGNFAAQRLGIRHRKERSMALRRHFYAQSGQEGEKLIFGFGHRCLVIFVPLPAHRASRPQFACLRTDSEPQTQ